MLNDTIKNEVVSKTFDNSVGDKASVLNLTLLTKSSVFVYKDADISDFAKQIISAYYFAKYRNVQCD